MSSAAGFSTSYSSLFYSGLDTAGRLPLAANRDFIGHRAPRGHHGFSREFPANIDSRRPSADSESMNSRRSSLPTFSSGQSDRRFGANNSFYAASSTKSPTAMAFTPSVLMRSDTNATKRSHFKSFLSMDANDYTQAPPLPSNLHSNTSVPGYEPQSGHKHIRNASVTSSALVPSMLPSPRFDSSANNSNYAKFISNGSPLDTEDGQRRRISISQSLYEEPTYNADHYRARGHDTITIHTYDGVISDEPPRLDVRIDSSSSRISFDPSSHGHIHDDDAVVDQARYAEARKSSITDPHSIPPRPILEPRVRSPLPTSIASNSVVSPPPPSSRPPIPPRSIQRNLSITSVSTFKSTTPSQRSAIKRSRRNEALARLEGNFYDPAPHLQENGSFMPFESDDEEDDADRAANSMLRKLVMAPAQPSSPPPIKPPSPLRARDRDQRKFLETGRLEPSTLDTIVESPYTPTAHNDPEFKANRTRPDQLPPIVVQSSMWPSFDENGEEEESLVTPQQPSTVTPLATYGPSPLGSRTNLVMNSSNTSSTSLSSFTPFSTDAGRPRNGTPKAASSNPHSPKHAKSGSGPSSISTHRSASRPSHDTMSLESFDSRDLGAALMDSQTPRTKQPAHSVQSQHTPWGSASSFGHEMQQRNAWAPTPQQHQPQPASKASKPKEKQSSKSKDVKVKKAPVQYETWLDMSGDEKAVKDASKKRKWLFGK